jgi:uncharacterized RDD family membrane protein YckC
VEPSEIPRVGISSRNADTERGSTSLEIQAPSGTARTENGSWRGALAERLTAYRTRRGKLPGDDMQAHFPFEDLSVESKSGTSIAIEEQTPDKEDFSFTFAIGKAAKPNSPEELPVEIDVSSQAGANGHAQTQLAQMEANSQQGLYPVASFDDRRLAGLIDFFCLAFAYGGFLGLFGSLGGHFTLSKLSAAVCVATFAVVYMQYFALFTIFGGTTPGMMMRGLQVVSFSGELPTPKQMLLRSVGYLLSAGTFFLGFLWAMWDSDELTWHDRFSRTYLSVEQTLPELESTDAAHSR